MAAGLVVERWGQLPHPALPRADWADSWQIACGRIFPDARAAAQAIVASFPKWTWPLLALRQLLVLPFRLRGLKELPDDRIAFFPVTAETPRQLVAGFDDRHLDFRIVVELAEGASGEAVSLTTVIRRHNAIGRTYLALVLPFHRAIIRAALRKAVSIQP
jgi:hypothetical protein